MNFFSTGQPGWKEPLMISDWIKKKIREKLQASNQQGYRNSLLECFELANSEVYTRSQMMLKNRAYEYFRKDDKISLLSDYLRSTAGLEKFQYIGCGDNAIVVRYSENQALRLRAPAVEGRANTQDVLQAPFISPVWKEVEFLGGRLNFVPFHRSLSGEILSGNLEKSVGKQIIYVLVEAAFRNDPPMWFYDYYNYDFKFEQVAILDDWTPLIIDQGGIIFEADAPDEYAERIASEKRSASEVVHKINIPWDGEWIDKSGVPKIELLEKPEPTILRLQSVCYG